MTSRVAREILKALKEDKKEHLRFRTYKILSPDLKEVIAKVVSATYREDENKFSTQFSFCDPRDFKKRYSRVVGKAIALLRLDSFAAIQFETDAKASSINDAVITAMLNEALRKKIHWMEGVTKYQIV